MKIAVASDDRTTISEHFGRARGFMVFDLQENTIITQEYRENLGRSTGECRSCDHGTMIKNISDCTVVISYGMGHRIYSDLMEYGITPVVTDERTVHEAIEKYLKNELRNRTEKLH